MALINKIREKSGLAVGIIAVGLGLFVVGGDLMGPNSAILGNNDRTVGTIAGNDISVEEYQQRIEQMKANYSQNFNRNPSEQEMNTIRQQAWEMLIVAHAFQKEYDELGLTVTEDEMVDMVQGKNISPEIRQAFTNPETGEFERDQVVAYLQNLSQMPAEQQAAWFNFEQTLLPGRLRMKYDNLLVHANYITSAQAEAEHRAQNDIAEASYLYVPFYAVSDSAVEVSDNELKSYIDNHKNQYKMDASRSLKYVTIPIAPSAEDSAFFKEDMDEVTAGLRNAENDSIYARRNTEGNNFFATYRAGQLPERLRANLENLSNGDLRGPYVENGTHTIYKITDIYEDTVAAARAAHILFGKQEGQDNTAKREQAENVLQQLKDGAGFEGMARQYSEDQSASRGGDLGWFTEGQMVEEFEEAVFGRNEAGLVDKIVETEYGFHIIRVTEPQSKTAYKVAAVQREMIASDNTRDAAFRKADYFAGTSGSLKEFEENAQKEGLQVRNAQYVGKNDRRIDNLGEAREMIRWAFNEGKKDKVSTVFELDNAYVVAVVTEEVEAGTSPVAAVRGEVTNKVKNQKKAAIIKDKLKGQEGSLDEIATAYGEDASVYNSSDIRLNSNSLPSVGFAPEAVGSVFGLQPGERSMPVVTESGVVILELQNLVPASGGDFESARTQVMQREANRIPAKLAEAVKEHADIKDRRHKFY